MDTKICPRCKRTLPLTIEFFWRQKSSSTGFAGYCRECSNESRKTDSYKSKAQTRKRNRVEKLTRAIDSYKSRRGCIECGESNPRLLTFHHTNPAEKSFGVVSDLGTRSVKAIEKEIEKCWIMCYVCHRNIHYNHSL